MKTLCKLCIYKMVKSEIHFVCGCGCLLYNVIIMGGGGDGVNEKNINFVQHIIDNAQFLFYS